ncbi:hypothetical protein F5880DRAFT_1619220, partial [Lentinula raphanica]
MQAREDSKDPALEPRPSVTRSGTKPTGSSGTTTSSLEEGLQDYLAVVLSNFDLASLLEPVHNNNPDGNDDDDEPVLCQYDLRRRLTTRLYKTTSLAQLAKFRPKIHPHPSADQAHLHIEDGATRRSRRLQRKREQDRVKRAAKRREAQLKLGCSIKSHQLTHVRETQTCAIPVDFDLVRSIADAPTWTGQLDLQVEGAVSLEDVKAIPGFQ